MPTAQRREELKEIARRGQEVYDRVVLPNLRPEDDGKFVALDIDTGEYEMDGDDLAAVMRLRHRLPGVVSWLVCVGHPTTYSIGGSAIRWSMERARKQRGDRYRYDWKLPRGQRFSW